MTQLDSAATPARRRSDNTRSTRKRRYRQRQASGKVVLLIVVDEVKTTQVLVAAHKIDPMREHSRKDLGHAVERLIDDLDREDLGRLLDMLARVPSPSAIEV